MKAFITVIGKDKVGIIAKVSNLLEEVNVNIEDISQTILQGMFTMIMLVDLSMSKVSIEEVQNILKTKSEKLGVDIVIRHEDIFNAMHRI